MKDSENEYGFDDLSWETSEEAVYALAASFRDVDRDDERPDEAEFTEKIAAELAAEQPILETPVPPPEPEPKNEAEKKRRGRSWRNGLTWCSVLPLAENNTGKIKKTDNTKTSPSIFSI